MWEIALFNSNDDDKHDNEDSSDRHDNHDNHQDCNHDDSYSHWRRDLCYCLCLIFEIILCFYILFIYLFIYLFYFLNNCECSRTLYLQYILEHYISF